MRGGIAPPGREGPVPGVGEGVGRHRAGLPAPQPGENSLQGHGVAGVAVWRELGKLRCFVIDERLIDHRRAEPVTTTAAGLGLDAGDQMANCQCALPASGVLWPVREVGGAAECE